MCVVYYMVTYGSVVWLLRLEVFTVGARRPLQGLQGASVRTSLMLRRCSRCKWPRGHSVTSARMADAMYTCAGLSDDADYTWFFTKSFGRRFGGRCGRPFFKQF